jgi:4-hydroxy-3-methylbut-2-enyl diphosphate reductase
MNSPANQRSTSDEASDMQVILANPRGFCAGVERAIEIVERAIEIYGAPVYVRHEVVHNKFVVQNLRERGAVFVEELDEVPAGAIVVFSAHGVSTAVRDDAAQRGLRVFDATCPLETKVHVEVIRHARAGRECILIGHAGHPEVEGTLGQYTPQERSRIYLVESADDAATIEVMDPANVAFVTQTTLSIDDTATIIAVLRERFPDIIGPRKDDICYATQNRQDAVKVLAESCDLILVVGSRNSSNSNRLREISEKVGIEAHLIDNAGEIDPSWLEGKRKIGVTAGASVPEVLVQEVIERLRAGGAAAVQDLDGRTEQVVFALPRELQER